MDEHEGRLSRTVILRQPETTVTFAAALTGAYRIIDVRSPREYEDGSLPGAVNVPIFDNDERGLVGTIYRQGGREEAIEAGFELVNSRLETLVAEFSAHRDEKIAIFCARGGMRSRSVVNLLNQCGYAAYQLAGGYKQYRQELLSLLAGFAPELIVIHGYTGTGKTRILQHLDPAIDLEDLAQHQSSLFGGMNRQPRSQKWFDTFLHQAICRLGEAPYFIEGESRQLGSIYLPGGLAGAMQRGHLVLVTASIETRVARILEDYPVNDEETVAQVQRILHSLRQKLGAVVVDELLRLLGLNRLAELVEILLVEYYDKRYKNSLNAYSYSFSLSSEDISGAARELTAYRQRLLT